MAGGEFEGRINQLIFIASYISGTMLSMFPVISVNLEHFYEVGRYVSFLCVMRKLRLRKGKELA